MSESRRLTSERKLEKWLKLLAEREYTGETIAVFCERIGVSKNTFNYWQKQLRELSKTETTPQGWALCVQTQPESHQIVVEINDCRITVTPETNTKFLAEICRTLKSLC